MRDSFMGKAARSSVTLTIAQHIREPLPEITVINIALHYPPGGVVFAPRTGLAV